MSLMTSIDLEAPICSRTLDKAEAKEHSYNSGILEASNSTLSPGQLLQVVISQDEYLDSPCSSDHYKYIESEVFDSDDDLEVRSEPVLSMRRRTCLQPAPMQALPKNWTNHAEPTTTSSMTQPMIAAPTKLLLEKLDGGHMAVVDKVTFLLGNSQ